MANANIKKLYFNKVAYEDIEWGDAAEVVTQTRNGQLVQLHKVDTHKVNGGQFIGAMGSGIQYMAQTSAVEDLVVRVGTNAFSVESFELVNGATLTIENGSTYKVL